MKPARKFIPDSFQKMVLEGVLKKYIIWLCIPLFLSALLICWLAKGLSSPPRRAIQDYHKGWLNSPLEHAVSIGHRVSPCGRIPYLVVEPDGSELSNRGQILREQLQKRGVDLLPFGELSRNVVIFHGRKGNKEDLLPIAERYAAVGYRCILPDLPAHGACEIERSYFGSNKDNRDAIYDLIMAEEDFIASGKRPVVWGMSMGGSFAAQLVGAYPNNFSKVIIINSFDCLENVVSHKAQKLVSVAGGNLTRLVKLCSTHLFGFDLSKADSVYALESFSSPVFIAHGVDDELIPIELGRTLYESVSSSNKQWVEVSNAHHNNVLVTEHQLFADTVEFIEK